MILRQPAVVFLLLAAQAAPAAGLMDGFTDPMDGKFDVSNYLAEQRGFLPVPLVITEPAVGVGLGAALVFLHDPFAGRTPEGETFDPQNLDEQGRLIPPSVSALVGFYTENDSWLAAGAHMGVWKNDTIRYTGALGTASFNLRFYGLGGNNLSLNFNIDADVLYQAIKFRLGQSDWWAGVDYLFLDTRSEFVIPPSLPVPPDIPNPAFDSRSASLGIRIEYDSRDSIFTPNEGLTVRALAHFNREAVGSDSNFNKYEVKSRYFTPLVDSLVLGLRADLDALDGEAPFYEYPFVNLRGIPAMRYQGERVAVGELDARWNFTFRWSLAGFLGAGYTDTTLYSREVDDTVYTRGLGFRYYVARRFGLHAGIDIARGPEDTAFYITVGSAWY